MAPNVPLGALGTDRWSPDVVAVVTDGDGAEGVELGVVSCCGGTNVNGSSYCINRLCFRLVL